jgi:putative oxidoreductase
MLMATIKVHAGKPIWVTAGGAELTVTNMAVQSALILAGPGKLSFDGLLGIRIPRWFGLASLLGMLGTVAWAVSNSRNAPEDEATEQEQEAGHNLQGGEEDRMDPAPADRPDLAADAPADRPGVESWGSPDDREPMETAPLA